MKKRLGGVLSWPISHLPVANGQPVPLTGSQFSEHHVSLYEPPLPSSTWMMQSPPGALHSESVLQNFLQFAKVWLPRHMLPAMQIGPMQLWPTATLPSAMHTRNP